MKDCPGPRPSAPAFIPLSALRPPLPKLDSIEACEKCTRPFDEASGAEPKLEYCRKADVNVKGKTYEGAAVVKSIVGDERALDESRLAGEDGTAILDGRISHEGRL